MKESEFWAEVKADLREAYASALYWQERARVAREQGDSDRERAYLLLMVLTFQITEQREQGGGQACEHLLAGYLL